MAMNIDVFFLENAAKLALESMLTRLDEAQQYRPFFWTELSENPPRLCHSEYDFVDTGGRYITASILARKMLAINCPDEREIGLRKFVISLQSGDDGLFYDYSGEDNPNECPAFLRGYETFTSKADIFCQSQALLALITIVFEENDNSVLERIERCIKALRSYASGDEKAGLTFNRRRISHGKFIGKENRATGTEGSVFSMTNAGLDPIILLEALSVYWNKTKDKITEEMIHGFINYIINEGKQVYQDGMYNGHTHCGAILPAMNGILTWALTKGEEEYIFWSKRVLDWTLRNSSSFGWVPDGLLTEPSEVGGHFCETCSLADTILLAIKLASAGFDEYWDVIDRFCKNQLIENQYRTPENIEPLQQDFSGKERLVRAIRGAFESWSRPFYIYANRAGIEGCCTSSAVRALYAIWNNAIVRKGQTVYVNLFISRTLPFAEIVSFEPQKGLLQINVRETSNYRIRIPAFLRREQVELTVNGRVVGDISLENNYLFCPSLIAGDMLAINYPLPRKRLREDITNGGQYWVSWLGNWVTNVEPISGLLESETDKKFAVPYPIYQRQNW